MTLNEAYSRADAIFVAQALGCADGAVPEYGRCPDARYQLGAIEVLKAPEPWRDLNGPYAGGDGMMHCGQTFVTGETYLLFVESGGFILTSVSGPLNGPYEQTRGSRFRLATLRDHRDGKTDDLSDPWIFTDFGHACELRQSVAGHDVGFWYPYVERWNEYSFSFEVDETGTPRLVNPVLITPENSGGLWPVVEGPSMPAPHTLSFDVQILYWRRTEADTASVTVDGTRWPLATQTVKLLRDGDVLGSSSKDVASPEAAHEILAAMLVPTAKVTIAKRGQFDPIDASTGSELPPEAREDVLIETRTTRFATDADKFLQCVSESEKLSVPEQPPLLQ